MVNTLIVESQAIDNGALIGEPKHSWLRVPRLRPRRDSTKLEPAKTESLQRISIVGIFIEPRGKANNMRKVDTHDGFGYCIFFCLCSKNPQQADALPYAHRLQRDVMRKLCGQPEKQTPNQFVHTLSLLNFVNKYIVKPNVLVRVTQR